jgi:hypothetical protein
VSRTTLPASPPAIMAKPMNKNKRARQTARESPKPSSPRTRSLSIKFTTSRPRRENMPGSQSTKATCTGTSYFSSAGNFACAERIAASRKAQLPSANYKRARGERHHWVRMEELVGLRGYVTRTRAPARYTPAVRLCFPKSTLGNGL